MVHRIAPVFLAKALKTVLPLIAGAALMLCLCCPAHAEDIIIDPVSVTAEQVEHTQKSGFPQLDTSTYPSQLFWLAIVFTLMFLSMSKIALPRVGSVIETRQKYRQDNLSAAAQAQSEGDTIQSKNQAERAKANDTAQKIVAESQQSAADKAQVETSRFAEHARARVTAAELAIAKAKNDAMASLADIAAEAACDIAQKIGGVTLQKADARKIVAPLIQKENA